MAPRTRRSINTTLSTLAVPPTLAPNQSLARIARDLGRTRFEITLPGSDDKPIIAALDARVRTSIWVGRGSYVLFQRYEPGEGRQKGEDAEGSIVNVVMRASEKEWKKMPYWPKEYPKIRQSDYEASQEDDSVVGKMPPSDSEEE